MKVGERVKVSPDLTGLDAWYEGLSYIENNRFNGIVISIKLDDGDVLWTGDFSKFLN